jgi:hypothetical protein
VRSLGGSVLVVPMASGLHLPPIARRMASHFKEEGKQLDLVSNTDLLNTFKSSKPREWTAKSYPIR